MHIHVHIHHECDPALTDFIKSQTEKIIMATQTQIDTLKADLATLFQAAADEITAALAAAQNASPDPAIDTLDATVKTVTQNLNDAATALRNGTPLPPPVTPTV